jgi:hypothetical protein
VEAPAGASTDVELDSWRSLLPDLPCRADAATGASRPTAMIAVAITEVRARDRRTRVDKLALLEGGTGRCSSPDLST